MSLKSVPFHHPSTPALVHFSFGLCHIPSVLNDFSTSDRNPLQSSFQWRLAHCSFSMALNDLKAKLSTSLDGIMHLPTLQPHFHYFPTQFHAPATPNMLSHAQFFHICHSTIASTFLSSTFLLILRNLNASSLIASPISLRWTLVFFILLKCSFEESSIK